MERSFFGLVDAHAHLQDSEFAADLGEVTTRYLAAGVENVFCNATCPDDWRRVVELSRAVRGVVPFLGLHPWFVKDDFEAQLAPLEKLLTAHSAGVGEIGIDRWVEPRNEQAQEGAFRMQLDIARRLNRPVAVHCLKAWGWLMGILRSEARLPQGFVIHAYGGAPELIGELLDLGAYFSFAGSALDPRKTRARESLRKIPRERLLVETDSPDLPLPPEMLSAPVMREI